MWRSIMAVLAGFFFIGILAFGADAILRSAMPGAFDAAGRVSSLSVLLLMQVYVGIFAIAGCYLTARLAPNDPMKHALILGGLGLLVNIAGAVTMWDTAPAWYHILAIALVMPYAWVGGRIRERQLERGHTTGSTPLAA